MPDPRGVQETPAVGAELGIGPVELGVVDVGLYDPGAEVVEHDATDHAVVEAERLDVRPHPGLLVHHQDRVDEQMAGEAEHHRERPHPAVAAASWISPGPEVAVVDLGFFARLHRRAPNDDLAPAHLLCKAGPHIAPKARHAHLQPGLIAEALVDHRHRHDADEIGDVVMVLGNVVPGGPDEPGVVKLREPPAHHRPPGLLADRRAPR